MTKQEVQIGDPGVDPSKLLSQPCGPDCEFCDSARGLYVSTHLDATGDWYPTGETVVFDRTVMKRAYVVGVGENGLRTQLGSYGLDEILVIRHGENEFRRFAHYYREVEP